MNHLIARAIALIIGVIPFSGYRTYITAILGVLGGGFLVLTGNTEVGLALVTLSLQAFFQRAGTDKAVQVSRLEEIENKLKTLAPEVAEQVLKQVKTDGGT